MRSWFDTTTISQRVVLLILLVGAILSAFYSLVYIPTSDQIENLRNAIHEIDQEILVYRGGTQRLVSIQEEVQILKSSLEQKTLLVPLEAEETELRQSIVRVARKYGVEMTYWLPEPPIQEPKSRFVRLPFQVRIKGGYHQVGQFLNQILLNPWVHEVGDIRMSQEFSVKKKHLLKTEFRLIGLVSHYQDKWSQLTDPKKL